MENLNNKSALSNILGLPKTVISELADEYQLIFDDFLSVPHLRKCEISVMNYLYIYV